MITAYIDGGSRGNPGPAAYGVRLQRPDGSLLLEFSAAIGQATNNVAEYRGLLAALEFAVVHHHDDLLVRSDSLLLVKQMRGEYRVRHAGLRQLYLRARALAQQIGRTRFEHVPRAANAEADRLANEAMDRAARSDRASSDA